MRDKALPDVARARRRRSRRSPDVPELRPMSSSLARDSSSDLDDLRLRPGRMSSRFAVAVRPPRPRASGSARAAARRGDRTRCRCRYRCGCGVAVGVAVGWVSLRRAGTHLATRRWRARFPRPSSFAEAPPPRRLRRSSRRAGRFYARVSGGAGATVAACRRCGRGRANGDLRQCCGGIPTGV